MESRRPFNAQNERDVGGDMLTTADSRYINTMRNNQNMGALPGRRWRRIPDGSRSGMYSKEKILVEIKRIAKSLGQSSLTQKDFEQNSTIPISTVKYYLGAWKNALKAAQLKPGDENEITKKEKKIDRDQLMLELIRLYEETGQEPTPALCNSQGNYGEKLYYKYWKNFHEAFLEARRIFPKQTETPISEDSKTAGAEVDMGLDDYTHPEGDVDEITHQEEPMAGTKIRFIPQTIKPKKEAREPRQVGDPLDFRGLRFAPVDKKGVMFLFGMVGQELGYIVESLHADNPDGEGRRCVSVEADRWENVGLLFAHKSSDLSDEQEWQEGRDLIVCWIHDWENSPVEVLELKSLISQLDDPHRE